VAEQTPDTEAGMPKANDRNQAEDTAEKGRQKARRRFIIILVVAILIVGGLLFYWHSTFYEDTDDAQVNGHLIQVSSRVTGNVIAVPVQENQLVKAGQVIVELDPTDYQNTVQQDQANLDAAESNLESAKVNIPVSSINSAPRCRRQLTR
jgi:membrane fusion protein (multidrug efflux system)